MKALSIPQALWPQQLVHASAFSSFGLTFSFGKKVSMYRRSGKVNYFLFFPPLVSLSNSLVFSHIFSISPSEKGDVGGRFAAVKAFPCLDPVRVRVQVQGVAANRSSAIFFDGCLVHSVIFPWGQEEPNVLPPSPCKPFFHFHVRVYPVRVRGHPFLSFFQQVGLASFQLVLNHVPKGVPRRDGLFSPPRP